MGYKEDWFTPFEVMTAERFPEGSSPRTTKEREDIAKARSLRYPKKCKGVYLYVDICRQNDPMRLPEDGSEQFTVIRYIGMVTTNFDDQRRTKQYAEFKKEIRHRWIEIIPIDGKWRFFIPALEYFLIENLSPVQNKQLSSRSKPQIFQEW
jgi:hypothetical protein